MATFSSTPRTVVDIFNDFNARRTALLRALTIDVEEFYYLCDPAKENLCLVGHPDESWEVVVPAEEVPSDIPEPVLGINFARDGMNRSEWLSLVAVHSDSWLISVAFCFGATLNMKERKRLFSMINDFPTLSEVVKEKTIKDKPTTDSGRKSGSSLKRSNDGHVKTNSKLLDESNGADEEHSETLCGSCGGNYNSDTFWICCDICEIWFHGKCVKISPAKAQIMEQYTCPSCNGKKGRP